MKKRNLTFFLALVTAFAIHAQEKTVLQETFDSFDSWFKNAHAKGVHAIIRDSNVKNCLQVKTGENQVFMMNLRRGFNITEESVLKVVFRAQGKGSVRFVFLGKSDPVPSYHSLNMGIDAKEWEEYSFTIPLPQKKNTTFKQAGLRINVNENSTIRLKDIKIVKLTE